MMVGEGKTEKDDGAESEDGDFKEANHTSLISSTCRAPARAMTAKILKRVGGAIETLAHFLTSLKERRQFLGDRNLVAGARIAASAGLPLFGRERAKAAQLDALAARERICDLAENCVNDILNVALIKMRIAGRHALDEFRLDHRMSPTRNAPTFASP
jgi:hypothetical protein